MCVQTNYTALERKLRERREEAAKQTTNLQAETSCTVLCEVSFSWVYSTTFQELIWYICDIKQTTTKFYVTSSYGS